MINGIRGRLVMLVLVLLALFLLLGSCTETKQTKLRVYAPPFLSCTYFSIAQSEGYYAEQGLEVEFVRMTGMEQAIPALIQGDLDIAPGELRAAMLNAIARGGEIKMVACAGSEGSDLRMTLVGKKALIETLDNPDKIRGLQISVSKMSISEYYAEKALNRFGLTLDDVVMRYDIPIPLRPESLESGAVDLIATSEPWTTRLLDSGDNATWMPAYKITPDLQIATLMYGSNLLKDNPDVGRRFMAAHLKSVRQYNKGKTPSNLEYAAKFTGLDLELLKKVNWFGARGNGWINMDSVMDFQDWALEKGHMDHPVPEDQILDSSFVDYANQALGAP